MIKRRLFLCVFVLAAFTLGGVLIIHLLYPRPRLNWNGHSSYYWISRLNHFDSRGNVAAEEFLFAAGPEVVPELIRGLSLHDNWLTDQWSALYFKLGSKWQRYFSIPIKRAHYRQNCAMGLGLLGPAASNAVPVLLRALRDKDSFVRGKAAEALWRTGADKARIVPELLVGVSSTNANDRLTCVIGLSHCLPGSPQAANALRSALLDPDWNIRVWAAESLWRDDSNREASFNTLVTALNDPHATVRDRAAQSVGKMRYHPTEAAAALAAALDHELRQRTNQVVIWKLLRALAEIGPAARAAVPLLSSLLADTNNLVTTLSLIALDRIEPDNSEWLGQLESRLHHNPDEAFRAAWELGRLGQKARTAMPALRRLAEGSDNWRTKAMAAAAAWRLDSSAPNPIGIITNNFTDQEYGHYEFVRLLGELGPAAQPAIPSLLRLRYSHGIMMHDYANEALEQIAPEYLTNPWKHRAECQDIGR